MKADVKLELPQNIKLPEEDRHFLLFIPWEGKYLSLVPYEYQDFFTKILPNLSKRTTNVHIAICMQYLDEFILKAKELGHQVNRDLLAYALMLHDIGWSQLTEEEIAASLGVKGLALNQKAMGPKEKHAVLGEQIARNILKQEQEKLNLSDDEVDLICKAVLFHDKPEEVAGKGNELPIEVKLLVDLDHIWSFVYLGFWMDVRRKGVDPKEYLENLQNDLDSYFVTEIGKNKAKELLAKRKEEVENEY